MELPIKKSLLQLFITLSAYFWAFIALWFTGIGLVLQCLITLLLLVSVANLIRKWLDGPRSVSLREERLHLHFSDGLKVSYDLCNARPHLFWIRLSPKLRRNLLPKAGVYLYRDSFSDANWCDLQRNVRRELLSARGN